LAPKLFIRGQPPLRVIARLLVASGLSGCHTFCIPHLLLPCSFVHKAVAPFILHCAKQFLHINRTAPLHSPAITLFLLSARSISFIHKKVICLINASKIFRVIFAIASKILQYKTFCYKCPATNHFFALSLHFTKPPQSTQSLPSPPEITKRCATLAETVSIRRAHSSRFFFCHPRSTRNGSQCQKKFISPFRKLHYKTPFFRHAQNA